MPIKYVAVDLKEYAHDFTSQIVSELNCWKMWIWKHFTLSKCTCQVYRMEYLEVSPSVVASILYKKVFLHFYFHIDYTFNVVRNECIQMERSAFVWIFELRQIMQLNCSYYNRKNFCAFFMFLPNEMLYLIMNVRKRFMKMELT